MKTKSKSNRTTFISKLGKSKGVERSRIWLEGKRLADAGFRAGNSFSAIWTDSKLVLKTDEVAGAQIRKVSGAADRPIIDITGTLVKETFGNGRSEFVGVSYSDGVITIVKGGPK